MNIYVSNLSFDTTSESLKELFAEWKGELEQIDDVCILGVRIN